MNTARLQGIFIGVIATSILVLGGHALAERIAVPAGPENPVSKKLLELANEPTNFRTSPNGSASIFPFAQGENAFIGLLRIEPGQSVGVHRDASEEYLLIFEGGGSLTMDGQQYDLGAGDSIFMRASAEVSFTNGPSPTVALQVFAGPESAKKYDGWKAGGVGPSTWYTFREEGRTNVDGIRTAQHAYHHMWDGFASAAATPPDMGGKERVHFTGGGCPQFEWLGWLPAGQVRCRYWTTETAPSPDSRGDFDVWAECDVDGDGVPAKYHANRADNAHLVTPANVY